MPSLKFIRKRISSVKNTQKITKAMKMVSAAKLRRATEKAQSSRPYEQQLADIVKGILQESSWSSPLTEERNVNKIALVVISTDRGLCGSLNSNVFKKVARFIQDECGGKQVEIIAFGKKARDHFKRLGMTIHSVELDLLKKGDYLYLEERAKELQGLFLEKSFDRVEVFFSEFRSALSQVPSHFQLLPFVPPKVDGQESVVNKSFILEPEGPEMLEKLVPFLINFRLYRVAIESFASEHAARMAAMDSATSNASDMIDRLTLDMNRARQAAITKELMEIIGGAEAISA